MGIIKYDTVLFDLDDTLIDRKAALGRAARRAYETLPPLKVGRSMEEVAGLLVGWERDGGPPGMTAAMLHEWPNLGLTPDELWMTFRGLLFAQIRPDPAVIALVNGLRHAGAKTGIITNGDARQAEKIRLAGLADLFDVVLVSDIVGIRKPDPASFQIALDQVESKAQEAVFAGDNPPVDIEGARSAGLATVWVRAGREWPDTLARADYEVDTVIELAHVLLATGSC